MAEFTLKDIGVYFGYENLGRFAADWKKVAEDRP